jgi:hypothetical protein
MSNWLRAEANLDQLTAGLREARRAYCASNWRSPLGKVSDHRARELKPI